MHGVEDLAEFLGALLDDVEAVQFASAVDRYDAECDVIAIFCANGDVHAVETWDAEGYKSYVTSAQIGFA